MKLFSFLDCWPFFDVIDHFWSQNIKSKFQRTYAWNKLGLARTKTSEFIYTTKNINTHITHMCTHHTPSSTSSLASYQQEYSHQRKRGYHLQSSCSPSFTPLGHPLSPHKWGMKFWDIMNIPLPGTIHIAGESNSHPLWLPPSASTCPPQP